LIKKEKKKINNFVITPWPGALPAERQFKKIKKKRR